MAVIGSGNWAFREPGDNVPDESIINGGNFSQAVPGTVILAGKTLTINGGNFVNVAKDGNWTINGGNWTQVSRCSHLHPEWAEAGYIAECVEVCPHVVETIEIVGGDDVYVYEDTVQ